MASQQTKDMKSIRKKLTKNNEGEQVRKVRSWKKKYNNHSHSRRQRSWKSIGQARRSRLKKNTKHELRKLGKKDELDNHECYYQPVPKKIHINTIGLDCLKEIHKFLQLREQGVFSRINKYNTEFLKNDFRESKKDVECERNEKHIMSYMNYLEKWQ